MSGSFVGSFTVSIKLWIGPNVREHLSLESWILLDLKFLRYVSLPLFLLLVLLTNIN